MGNQQLECETLYNLGVLHGTQRDFDAARVQLEAALLLVRDLGYAMLECAVVGSLGMVCADQGRLDEASHYLDAALAMARELGERRREGIFQSDLGTVRARQAQFDVARACLDASEVLFNAISDRWDLCLLLCNRAEAEHISGAAGAARVALAAADAIAAELAAGPNSELGRELARIRVLLGHEQ